MINAFSHLVQRMVLFKRPCGDGKNGMFNAFAHLAHRGVIFNRPCEDSLLYTHISPLPTHQLPVFKTAGFFMDYDLINDQLDSGANITFLVHKTMFAGN